MQIQTLFCKKSDQKTTLFCKKSDQNTDVFCKKSDQKYSLGHKKLKYGLPQHLVYGEITAQLYT